MKSSIFLVLLSCLFFSYAAQGKEQATGISKSLKSISKNDSVFKKEILKHDTLPKISRGKMTLVKSGQMSPYTIIKIEGCDFHLVTTGNDTTYLTTIDKKFQTPEGYKVGTKFSELPKDLQSELTNEPGWGYYHKLLSGWSLGFCEGSTCTENYPKPNSQVKWIFKRRH